jgi:hypothetical protein
MLLRAGRAKKKQPKNKNKNTMQERNEAKSGERSKICARVKMIRNGAVVKLAIRSVEGQVRGQS